MEEGDIVGYQNTHKRVLFGDMVIVHLLPNNRADVRRHNSDRQEVWTEYLSDLELLEHNPKMKGNTL